MDTETCTIALASVIIISMFQDDRVEGGRKKRIGTIEVVRHATAFICEDHNLSWRDTKFDQANKKDATEVTGGRHTMSTTKKGNVLRPAQRSTEIWQWGAELGRLGVNYRMGHTLQASCYTSHV